jgi:hypothetical protein
MALASTEIEIGTSHGGWCPIVMAASLGNPNLPAMAIKMSHMWTPRIPMTTGAF